MMATTGKEKRTALSRRAAAANRKIKEMAEQRIDACLREIGVGPDIPTERDGTRHVDFGDFDAVVFAGAEQGKVVFRVGARVMPLPSDKELVVPLTRELLECNVDLWGAPRFSIVNEQVFVTVTEEAEDMDDEDFRNFIFNTIACADAFVRELRKRFGGTTRKRKRSSIGRARAAR